MMAFGGMFLKRDKLWLIQYINCLVMDIIADIRLAMMGLQL